MNNNNTKNNNNNHTNNTNNNNINNTKNKNNNNNNNKNNNHVKPKCLGFNNNAWSKFSWVCQHAKPTVVRPERPRRLGSGSHTKPTRLSLASNIVVRPKVFESGNSCQTQSNNKERKDNDAL